MKIHIYFAGPLATAAGASTKSVDMDSGVSIADLIKDLAGAGTEQLQKHLLNEEGLPHPTLIVALDGVQVKDIQVPIPDSVREVMLVSPMAGG